MAKKPNANLAILLIVALLAAVFAYQYANPTESLGAQPSEISQVEVREILLLEAEEQNITITQREMLSAYLGLQNKSGMDNESYHTFIIETHGSKEAYDKLVESNLKVLKVINENVDWERIQIEDEQIDAFIRANPEIFPAEQLNDPMFKETLYQLARQQMFESQRQQLIDEYVQSLVAEKTDN